MARWMFSYINLLALFKGIVETVWIHNGNPVIECVWRRVRTKGFCFRNLTINSVLRDLCVAVIKNGWGLKGLDVPRLAISASQSHTSTI